MALPPGAALFEHQIVDEPGYAGSAFEIGNLLGGWLEPVDLTSDKLHVWQIWRLV